MADSVSDYRQALERVEARKKWRETHGNTWASDRQQREEADADVAGLLDRIAELTIENDRLHKRESWFDKNDYWRKQAVEYLLKVDPERATLGWSENTKHIVQELLIGRDRIAELEAKNGRLKAAIVNGINQAVEREQEQRIEQLEAALQEIADDDRNSAWHLCRLAKLALSSTTGDSESLDSGRSA